MSDYWDFVPAGAGNPLSVYLQGMDFLRAISHGGNRAMLDSLPISGAIRRWKNDIKKAEDRYRNTGVDESYSSPYASPIPLLNDVGGAVKPVRMAKSLMGMYGAEVQLNIAKEYTRAGREWSNFQYLKNKYR